MLAGGLAVSVVALAGMAGVVRETTTVHALTNCTVSDVSVDSEEAAFLSLINAYRAQNGLGALTISTNLTRAATWHGTDMGQKRYFSHTDSLGRSPSTRAQNCGYPSGAGENIAAGTVWDTAQEAFTAWRNSSGHNANMLNSSYKKIGIARVYVSGSPYGYYWVTNFGLVEDGTSGGGGQATATPTRTATPAPTQPPQSSSPATISSPAAGSTLGSSATFNWSGVSGALEYFVYVGTSAGSNNILGKSTGTTTSTTVTNLPMNGSTLYVRLWTRFANGWQYRDVTYRAGTTSSGGSTLPAKATLTTPTNGSTLGTSATFQWTAASGALEYFFYAGTTPGSNNLIGASTGTNRGISINNLPRGGRTIYVRLWTRTASGWEYNDYSFRGPN